MNDFPLTGGCNCGAVRFEVERAAEAHDGGQKCFCGDCGSSLVGRNPSHADPISIRMGAFDDDPGIRPSVSQFAACAAPWEPIPDDGLPRHPESRHTPR
jgi:hypothetical protein